MYEDVIKNVVEAIPDNRTEYGAIYAALYRQAVEYGFIDEGDNTHTPPFPMPFETLNEYRRHAKASRLTALADLAIALNAEAPWRQTHDEKATEAL